MPLTQTAELNPTLPYDAVGLVSELTRILQDDATIINELIGAFLKPYVKVAVTNPAPPAKLINGEEVTAVLHIDSNPGTNLIWAKGCNGINASNWQLRIGTTIGGTLVDGTANIAVGAAGVCLFGGVVSGPADYAFTNTGLIGDTFFGVWLFGLNLATL